MSASATRFFGRKRLLDDLTQRLLASQPGRFSLVGPRLIGKSHLLTWLAAPQGPLHGQSTSSAIVLTADCNRPEVRVDLAGYLETTLVEVQTAGEGGSAVQSTPDATGRLVLLVDHFDRLWREPSSRAPALEALESFSQNGALLIAADQPLYDLIGDDEQSAFLAAAPHRTLGLLESDAAHEWLRNSIEGHSDLGSTIDAMAELTGAHPYLLRCVADVLIEVQEMLPHGTSITAAHMPLIRLRLAEFGRPLFEMLWREIRQPPARVDACAASALVNRLLDGSMHLDEIDATQSAALNWLINQAVVTFGSKGACLFSPLFAEFVADRLRADTLSPVIQTGSARARGNGSGASIYDTLTKTEIALLRYFEERSHEIISAEQLLADIWRRPDASTRRVQEAIRRLRLQLERAQPPVGVVANERGRGYRFIPAEVDG